MAEGRAPARGRGAALRRAQAPRCHSGWRRPLQEGPLPALPAPSLASADADVGAGSWRDARISAGRLLGAGALRYLPSGAGAGASRAGCKLQRETPGCRGGRGCQAKAASIALCRLRVPGGSPHPHTHPPPHPGAEEHHPPSLPQILPRAWTRGGCVRPRNVRQPPGSGRETGEHLRPHPSRFPTGVRPPFFRPGAGLPIHPLPGPLWIVICV